VLQLRQHFLQLQTKVISYCNLNVQRYQVQHVILSFSEGVYCLNTAAIGSEQAKDRTFTDVALQTLRTEPCVIGLK